ncbi:2-isopropylmalate synthase [Turicibacter bilis]|uniref:2-isopropylmalate synthase n=2 Tax=Turicibacter bilis TaxID=2735723 RepID=A0A9Q9CN43_9FIRM|nr:2-isopropylmalate synthase [Turicibacter bilis]MBS3198694.1 2-isopropylmalate synthase [Turicibacter bilis]MDD6760633.1 2-isopropylmalate synthase [Turicibacter sp.]UUF07637.1 2-isopropylmalate synthase [Turicibacter bilis]
MIKFNNRTNLMEAIEFNYLLNDVKDPNLYRDVYPYDEIPKVTFNHTRVPIRMPDDIFITDTSFRDGQQSRAPYTVDQMVTLYEMLHRLGGPQGKIRQSEFFLYSKKDREAVYRCLELDYEFPEITAWIRANKDDFQLVHEMGLKETGILVSCSDYHIFKKLKMTRKEAFDHYLGIVKQALEVGIIPRCHLEDITRADFYGFVVPFAMALKSLSNESGVPIKVRACDTMGYGVTYPGAALPRSVQGIIFGLNHHAQIPSEQIEWHGHNDFYKAVNNSSNAWLYGASGVNCTMLGIGERTGNTPLEAMVFEYAQLKGTLDGMDPTVITEIASYYEHEIGYKVASNTPFVGKNFNVTRAGIHADGLLKNEEIYNIFDTDKFLNRPPLVSISAHSGLAGIAHWVNSYYQLKEEEAVDKNSALVCRLKRFVDQEFEQGRIGIMSDEELANYVEFLKSNGGVL